MKKILLVIAVAALTLPSCKKDYACECTYTSKVTIGGSTTTTGPNTESYQTGKMKKADAKTKCEEDNGTVTSGTAQNGGEVTTDCKIK